MLWGSFGVRACASCFAQDIRAVVDAYEIPNCYARFIEEASCLPLRTGGTKELETAGASFFVNICAPQCEERSGGLHRQ